MIKSIAIEGFKSLEKVAIQLGNLNIFIGANGSGKSNFLEAIRILQGIGYGFAIDEIFNGKPKSVSCDIWEPIRGGSRKADFVRRNNEDRSTAEKVISLSVSLKLKGEELRYCIQISAEFCLVVWEKFEVENTVIFEGKPTSDRSIPLLHQFLQNPNCSDTNVGYIKQFINFFSNLQYFDPSPAILRDYARAKTAKRMGDRGENFAALIKTIIADESEKAAFISWLKELTNHRLDDICILDGALGESLFAIKEGEINYPAPILADGFLRFAAITAAFFQPQPPAITIVENIESGLHPRNLRVLVEMLKNLSQNIPIQVIVTTQSPLLLDWLGAEDYRTSFACKREEETGATRIVPFKEVPKLVKIVDKYPVGELFAEGWFEGGII